MEKSVFFEKLVESLELEDTNINENSPLYLSSLQVLSMIAFADENFNKQIKASEFKSIKTVKDLMLILGI